MNIPITINGSKIILDARPEESLMSILRKNDFPSVKCGCTKGFCGSCVVLLNDNPVPSCKIPVGIIRDNDVVTLEYFEGTKEYQAIMQGFEFAGIKLCGYCNSGKIFTTYQILKMNRIPSRSEITNLVKTLSPCCTDQLTLVNGIIWALEIMNKGYETALRKFKASKMSRK